MFSALSKCCKMLRKKKMKEAVPKRIKITLDLKREIIENHERGASVASLSRRYNRTSSTICTILKNKDKIKKADASKGVTRISAHRTHVLDDVERLLLIWINEKRLLGEAIKESAVCKKAKTIFHDLVEKKPNAAPLIREFKASHGWFEKFKRRIGVLSFVEEGERANHNLRAVNSFIKDFKKLLDNYLPQQVFSCNEMSLLWKKMPKRMDVMEKSQTDQEPKEDHLSLLLCANASADFKIKPLLVYSCETPKAFRKCRVQKNELNVMWRSNAKAGITRELFIEWINQMFGPSVKKYLLDMNLPLQALLVVDSTPTHLPDLQDDLLHEFKFIKSQYLPVKMGTLLQPVDQHVISDFKKLYTKALFERCFEVTQETNLTVQEFWKDHFHIVTCLKLIEKAWQQVTKRTLTSGWRRLWPESGAECAFEEFEAEPTEPVVEETLLLGKNMGLEINHHDIKELLQEYKAEMTTEELLELHRVYREEAAIESSDREENETRERLMSSSSIKEMLNAWKNVTTFIKEHHPVRAVALHAINLFTEDAVSPFQQILKLREKRMTPRISHC